jgi:GH35 family endo-1,4-beta-xylanase
MPSPELEEAYRRRFAALLNFATLGFYWNAYEREQGKPDYAYTDRAAAWCREQGIRCKGHPLAWDYTPDPRWLPEDFAEIRAPVTGPRARHRHAIQGPHRRLGCR